LTSRQLPEMALSKGDEISFTAPPAPIPHYLDATGRAVWRFSVEGVGVGMFDICLNVHEFPHLVYCVRQSLPDLIIVPYL
jgi:hypothetical protein